MRILYVYDGNWPRGATRVVKETRSFVRGGHEVHLISRNELREPRTESVSWMDVHRLPSFGPDWLNRAVNFPYFFNPFWIWTIHSVAKKQQVDCIVVADLPLAPTALWVARVLGLPVYYDMAEIYPEFLRGLWSFDEMGWSDYLVRNPTAADLLERYVLRRVNKTFVVSEESGLRCQRLGVPADRLVLVGNTPENPEDLERLGDVPADLAQFEGRPILLFVGILIGDRGVAVAIEAMRHVVEQVPEAVLVVVGDGPERPRLEALVKEMALESNVAILGWKDHADLPGYYSGADIGLLPFLDGAHVRVTLANKLFDYMGAGLAVVASDLPPMRRIVEECGSGLLAEPSDPVGLAQSIVQLLEDDGRRESMGESGRRAVFEKYCWIKDEERLLNAIDPSLG